MYDSPNLCMFCGKVIATEELSMEHFVPKGLWEDANRPPCIKTLPAHKSCNQFFSSDNEYFRDVLIMVEGATQKCESARKVSAGSIRRKFQKRFGSIVKTAKNIAERPTQTSSGIYLGMLPSFEIDWPRMQRVLFNVMKGIFYQVEKTPMPQDFELEVYDTETLDFSPYKRTVDSMVDWQSFGDDAFLCRYTFVRRPPTQAMACLMQFYRNRMFYGAAMSPQFIEEQMKRKLFTVSRPGSSILVPAWATER